VDIYNQELRNENTIAAEGPQRKRREEKEKNRKDSVKNNNRVGAGEASIIQAELELAQ
jgi:hypothetical protein